MGEEHKVEGLFVSGGFFQVLGVEPLLGRVFNDADDRRGCGGVGALVSYASWQQELGGDAAAVGRKIALDGHPFPVIEVTPKNFFGVDVGHQFEVAVPLCSEPLLEPDRDSIDKREPLVAGCHRTHKVWGHLATGERASEGAVSRYFQGDVAGRLSDRGREELFGLSIGRISGR
jgi:hypothetical protein